MSLLEPVVPSDAGLPDGFFSNPKFKFGQILASDGKMLKIF
jgi:hypothetical protein